MIADSVDVIVIGGGHAGCEAGLASARLGLKTIVFTLSADNIAFMPCNPHIGGSSKGHLVREIDALGGEMGKNIDKTLIQIKMLNTSKGPAVHSLRAQADRKRYQMEMKHTIIGKIEKIDDNTLIKILEALNSNKNNNENQPIQPLSNSSPLFNQPQMPIPQQQQHYGCFPRMQDAKCFQ